MVAKSPASRGYISLACFLSGRIVCGVCGLLRLRVPQRCRTSRA
nr:MAG TPA: Recombinase zinc beta ribbon domain [Caudoviricetes sp.]